MLPMTQGLAEYVSISASSARVAMGNAMRGAVAFGSDHFVVLVVGLILIVLAFMALSGSRH